jgi:hypothetical protein
VTVRPMTARSASAWKPSVEKGIRTSTNQPSAVTDVSASQYASQLSFVLAPSSDTRTSNRMAAGVVPNHLALVLSLNAST